MPRQQQVTILPLAVKSWRGQRGFSQSDLGRHAGCSEGLIAQIETSRRQPGLANAAAIAKALGVPLGAIALIHVDVDGLAEASTAAGTQGAA